MHPNGAGDARGGANARTDARPDVRTGARSNAVNAGAAADTDEYTSSSFSSTSSSYSSSDGDLAISIIDESSTPVTPSTSAQFFKDLGLASRVGVAATLGALGSIGCAVRVYVVRTYANINTNANANANATKTKTNRQH